MTDEEDPDVVTARAHQASKDRRHALRRRQDHVTNQRRAVDVETISVLSQTMRSLLVVHMLGAIATGALFLAAPTTGPTFTLLSRFPGWPYSLASPLLIAGLTALLLHFSAAPAQVLVWPMRIIALWYFVFAASFAIAWSTWALVMAAGEPRFGTGHIVGSVIAIVVVGIWQVSVVVQSPPPPRWVMNVLAAGAVIWLAYAFSLAISDPLVPAPAAYPVIVYSTIGFLLVIHLSVLERLQPPHAGVG